MSDDQILFHFLNEKEDTLIAEQETTKIIKEMKRMIYSDDNLGQHVISYLGSNYSDIREQKRIENTQVLDSSTLITEDTSQYASMDLY